MHDDPRPTPRRQGRRTWSCVVALVVTIAGCGSATTPSGSVGPSPSVPTPIGSAAALSTEPTPLSSAELSAIYSQINQQVRAIRGLDEKTPVQPTILSKAEMAALLTKQVAADSPPASVAADERLYHALGVLPKGDKLTDVYGNLLESQVAGLYVPTDKKLYVVSKGGGVGPIEKVYYSHEYTHALQDQNFDLGT